VAEKIVALCSAIMLLGGIMVLYKKLLADFHTTTA